MSVADIFAVSIADIFMDFDKILSVITIELKMFRFNIPITLTGFNRNALINIITLLFNNK